MVSPAAYLHVEIHSGDAECAYGIGLDLFGFIRESVVSVSTISSRSTSATG